MSFGGVATPLEQMESAQILLFEFLLSVSMGKLLRSPLFTLIYSLVITSLSPS